jgi:glycosyltransferase involved in cell wall biosynthesis
LVSVIVPNYNHSRFLEERVGSILNQTRQDFEIIILDDCSTDNSKTVIEKYRNNDRVSTIVYNTVNSGSPFRQWKKGIDLAKGKYIWIAESDDSASPLFLEKLVPLLAENHAVMAFSDSMTIDEKGCEIPGWKTLIDTDPAKGYAVLDGTTFIKERMIFGNRINNASAVVFKTETAKQIAGYETFKYSGDWFFWCCVILRASFVYLNEKLNYFRQHQNRASIEGHRQGETYIESLRIINFILETTPLNFFFHQYIGGYYLKMIITQTRHINKAARNAIVSEYRKTFPLMTFCLVYFFYRKAITKILNVSGLRKAALE